MKIENKWLPVPENQLGIARARVWWNYADDPTEPMWALQVQLKDGFAEDLICSPDAWELEHNETGAALALTRSLMHYYQIKLDIPLCA